MEILHQTFVGRGDVRRKAVRATTASLPFGRDGYRPLPREHDVEHQVARVDVEDVLGTQCCTEDWVLVKDSLTV